MTDEEILKFREDNPDTIGEYERERSRKAAIYASSICVILCTLMFCLDLWIKKYIDFGKPAILLAFASILNMYDGRATRKRKYFVWGIIEIVIMIFCLILYIGELFI